ncbi:MAG: GFA family protein [Kofleriaceae bacterium]
MARGSCACGAVTFDVDGDLNAPDACHCVQCRKQSGHFWVSVAVSRADLVIHGDVRWWQSSERIRRGFCASCGSSLFWDPIGASRVGIALGAIDTPTGVHLEHHIFTAEKGDYYDVPKLPPPLALITICRALALVDEVLAPHAPMYQFINTTAVLPSCTIIFNSTSALLKGSLEGEPVIHPAELFHGVPSSLATFADGDHTFGGFYADGTWTIRGDTRDVLEIPSGQVDIYCAQARERFGRDIPRRTIGMLFNGAPLDDTLRATLTGG